MDNQKLIDELVRDEAMVLTVYVDNRSDSPDAWTDSKGRRGIPTIGIGTNLLKPISKGAAYYLCNERLESTVADLDQLLPWWRKLDEVRQRVLANMAFNMGAHGLLAFHHFLAAMQAGAWIQAAAEMRESAWWSQVGPRALRLQRAVATGVMP